MDPIHSERDLHRLRLASSAHAVIAAWSGAGHFDVLSDGVPRLLSTLKGSQRALRMTAPILAHIGLLIEDRGHWAMSQSALALHARGAFDWTGAEEAMAGLVKLDEVLRTGTLVRKTDIGVSEEDPDKARAFMNMLYRRSGASVKEVVRWLSPRLDPGARILDLGGGHGRYSDALTEGGFDVTMFDLPVCAALARERYGTDFQAIAGDFMKDDLAGPYDAIFLSNIIHGLGAEKIVALYRRLREAIVPGGQLVVKDMFVDDLGASSELAQFFRLTMLMYTEDGGSYTLAEHTEFLTASGFVPAGHVMVSDQGFALVFGVAE